MEDTVTQARTTGESFESLLSEATESASRLDRHGLAGPGVGMSFSYQGRIYITRDDCDFGMLRESDFSCVTSSGRPLNNIRACRELPLHLMLYRQRGDVRCVLHTHSPYVSLWSCLDHMDPRDAIPAYTPHIGSELGPVGLVPYAPPGSPALVKAFLFAANGSKAYLLKNHGIIVGESCIAGARRGAELLEEGARLAWIMHGRAEREEHIISLT